MNDRPALPVIVLAIAAALVVLGIAMQYIGGMSDEESASESLGSPLNAEKTGTSGWVGMMERLGYDARLLDTPFDKQLPDEGTIVTVAPEGATKSEAEALDDWLRAKPDQRRVVIVGDTKDVLLPAIVPVKGTGTAPSGNVSPVADTAETKDIKALDVNPEKVFDPGDTEVLYAVKDHPEAAYAVASDVDEARALAVIDADAVVNAGITQGQNAGFAARIVGPKNRPVFFDIYHHGLTGQKPGVFGFLPWTVQTFLLQLLATAVVFAIGAAIRFGSPLTEPEADPRHRVEFVNAMARAYESTDAYTQAAQLIREDLRERLRQRLHVGRDTSDDWLISAAPQIGLDADTARRALTQYITGTADLRHVATAAAQCRTILTSGVIANDHSTGVIASPDT